MGKTSTTKTFILERILAKGLLYGTWFASAVIGLGIVLRLSAGYLIQTGLMDALGLNVIKAGIAIFIVLPIVRLITMLIFFLSKRDYVFGVIVAMVLLIIAIGLVLGANL